MTAETQRTAEFAEKSTVVSAVGLVAIRVVLSHLPNTAQSIVNQWIVKSSA
jgi:hypothetical protein